jgi:hypothetical protein
MKANKMNNVVLLFSLLIFGCSGPESTSDKNTVSETTEMTDSSVLKTLQEAFRWGYPMMAMTYNNTVQYETTLNAFYNMKKAADEKSQLDKGFNAETLYSAGALDLSAEPVVFTVPPVGKRFFVFPIQDAWGNIDNVIGTRTEGNNGGNYLITGPGWKGDVPKGMKQFEVKTNVAFLPGRSMVTSTEDAKDFASNLQDKFTITPLSRWGKGAPNANRDSEKDPILPDPARSYSNILANMSVGEYFNKLNELLQKNPPYDYDKPVLEKFERLGIGAGLQFDTSRLSAAVKDSMALFIKNDPVESGNFFATRGMTPEAAKFTSRFGTNYNERYLQLFGGIGGNLSEDAMYFWLKKDTEGIDLNGVNKYKVHFEAAQIPKTKAFWSLTLYNKDFFLPQNLPMNRHVRNSNSGMVLNADGSLDVYLQPESPGKNLEKNWLPTPPENYFVVLRAYWANEDILNGTWKQPVPVRLK